MELVKEAGAGGGWTEGASGTGNGTAASTTGAGAVTGCVAPSVLEESIGCGKDFQDADDTEYDFFSAGFSGSGSGAKELAGGGTLALEAPLLVPIVSR